MIAKLPISSPHLLHLDETFVEQAIIEVLDSNVAAHTHFVNRLSRLFDVARPVTLVRLG